jgi:hypothetical protein
MADNFNFVQLQDLKLAGSGVSLTDTTIVLQSMKLIDGVTNVTMAMFGAVGMAVIEPDTSREENISFTGITQNADQTATLTGVTRGLDFKTPYTAVAGNRKAHAGGSIMRISNTAPFYNQIAVKDNDESILGAWTFPNAEPTRPKLTADTDATDAKSLVTLGQVARTAVGGAVNASTTVAGLVEIATQAEVDDGTSIGGTGAILAAPASALTEGRLNIHRYVAGEAIDASISPQAVYLKESDGKVYKATSATAAAALFSFIGFVGLAQNVVMNDTVYVQTDGLVSGFTGLTVGSFYFVADTAGTISTSGGTIKYQIGRAVTTTKLLIEKGKKVYSGFIEFFSTSTSTITTGFRPTNIIVHALSGSGSKSDGGWNPTNGNRDIYYVAATGVVSSTTESWTVITTVGNYNSGIITNITSTSFDLSNTKTGAPSPLNIYLFWVAEGN